MRVLANENVPGLAVDTLRTRGHDVVWIRTDAPGLSDLAVIQRAVTEQRIVVTFDKDFGELVFRAGLPAACGIVLFRIPASSPEYVARTMATVLESRDDWAGHFAVIDETQVRLAPLP